jgi:O-antigen/teichoic acid export membrane protein
MSLTAAPVAGAGQMSSDVVRASIAANSFWYGLETVAEVLIGVASSIAIARAIGPQRLGYFVYLTFLTNVVGRLGAEGVATAARRYMSEYLARGEMGLARSVFFATLRLQTTLSAAVVLFGVAIAWFLVEPHYRLAACLLVLSVAPALVNVVPSQANMAAERFSRNIPSTIAGLVAYAIMITVALARDWSLAGLASAFLIRRLVEMTIRLVPAIQWMLRLPVCSDTKSVNRKLLTVSAQNLAITVLTLVVWDRSEIVFLKAFCDVRQLAFYSVAFSVAGYLALLPNVIGAAIGANVMVEYARGRSRTSGIAEKSIRFLALIVLPLNCGIAALSGPAIRVAYGPLYAAAIPVLAITAVLAIPKSFYWLPYTIHLAADKQVVVLRWLIITAGLNVGMDALLIPRYGAVGAAIANGLAQSFTTAILLARARQLCPMKVLNRTVGAIVASAVLMAVAAALLAFFLPALPAAIAGVIVGGIVYFGCLRLTRALSQADLALLDQGFAGLPPAVCRYVRPIVALAVGGRRHIVPETIDTAVVAEPVYTTGAAVSVPHDR